MFNLMVGTHSKTLMIYQNVTLSWAAQLPHIPVDAKVANFAYVFLIFNGNV
jgi:Bardet-Biedl syndrome 9 protein